MLHYCQKCGRRVQNCWDEENFRCDCCNSYTFPVPQKYLYEGCGTSFKDNEAERLLIEELVKTSPSFDQYLFEHRDEILSQKHVEFQAKMAHGKAILEEASKTPKCPTCQSSNIRRMGGVERGASVWAFGLFSRKINKTFKCNHCGYTW